LDSLAELIIGFGEDGLDAGRGADCDCAQPNRKSRTAGNLRTLD
jgi:hypothetical protein